MWLKDGSKKCQKMLQLSPFPVDVPEEMAASERGEDSPTSSLQPVQEGVECDTEAGTKLTWRTRL